MLNAKKLQSVTKYIDTWSKSVNIFKTFERVQHPPPQLNVVSEVQAT